jgi:hypothetical protein
MHSKRPKHARFILDTLDFVFQPGQIKTLEEGMKKNIKNIDGKKKKNLEIVRKQVCVFAFFLFPWVSLVSSYIAEAVPVPCILLRLLHIQIVGKLGNVSSIHVPYFICPCCIKDTSIFHPPH